MNTAPSSFKLIRSTDVHAREPRERERENDFHSSIFNRFLLDFVQVQ